MTGKSKPKRLTQADVTALVFAFGFELTQTAQAGERRLSATEIEEALAGNTVDGNTIPLVLPRSSRTSSSVA